MAFISIGVMLGTLMPSARAAQGLGLTVFFPMFLLAGGGPPPVALTSTMRAIADWLPLTHAIRSILEPWLGLGDGRSHLLVVATMLVLSGAIWMFRSSQVNRAA